MTTAIHTATDLAVSALVMKLTVSDALSVAITINNQLRPKKLKGEQDYAHLDNGRRAMCAGNILRGLARKHPEVVDQLMDAVERLTGFYPESFEPRQAAPKAKRTKKPAPGLALMPSFDWPKSRRFQYAAMANGEQKFFYNAPKGLDYWQRPESV